MSRSEAGRREVVQNHARANLFGPLSSPHFKISTKKSLTVRESI